MEINLQEKVALVTGGSTGIGKETALLLAECGAKVVVNYRESDRAALEVVSEIKKNGGQALAIPADVTQKGEINAMVQQLIANFGSRIDILINNAGSLIQRCSLLDLSEDIWDKVMEVNVKSIFLVTQAVVPYMGHGGRIVNVSSIAARTGGGPGSVHYAAAKGAVNTLTWGMAKELIEHGIIVNAVAPGLIATPFHVKYTESDQFDNMKVKVPIGREGEASEIAKAIVFLASEHASYFMGEIMEVNGGWWMG